MSEENHRINPALAALKTPMERLYEHPKNARKHGERNLLTIQASLNEFGQQKPIVFDSETGEILAGNGTFRAANALGWTHIAAVPFDKDKRRGLGYMEADNRTSDLSAWDDEKHAEALKELQEISGDWSITLEDMGWSETEVAALIEMAPPPPDDGALGVGDGPAPESAPTPKPRKEQPRPAAQPGTFRIEEGDCREVMARMEPESVTAIVTDPPYGLDFMGHGWDHAVPGVEFWTAALRVLKPGGMLLAFGGTRTWHRLACAIEDAGFEIRDCLCWLYGSGFPKSLQIGKAIDREAGAERQVVGPGRYDSRRSDAQSAGFKQGGFKNPETATATPEAAEWEGYGSALKPAFEPIILAMKPLDGTYAQNALRHGVAGLNVDATRIPTSQGASHNNPYDNMACTCQGREGVHENSNGRNPHMASSGVQRGGYTDPPSSASQHETGNLQSQDSPDGCHPSFRSDDGPAHAATAGGLTSVQQQGGVHRPPAQGAEAGHIHGSLSMPCPKHTTRHVEKQGRWPANLLLDRGAAELLDQQSGHLHPAGNVNPIRTVAYKPDGVAYGSPVRRNDASFHDFEGGGASRFFYTSKASRREREAGLQGLPESQIRLTQDASVRAGNGGDSGYSRRNTHATVKPIDLMRWLCRLVKMPKGTVILDPFTGSGTTGCAAVLEGCDFIGIELNPEYAKIAKARVAWWAGHPEAVDEMQPDGEDEPEGEEPADGL